MRVEQIKALGPSNCSSPQAWKLVLVCPPPVPFPRGSEPGLALLALPLPAPMPHTLLFPFSETGEGPRRQVSVYF